VIFIILKRNLLRHCPTMSDLPPASPSPSPAGKRLLALAVAFAVALCTVPVFFNPAAQLASREWFAGTDTYMPMLHVKD